MSLRLLRPTMGALRAPLVQRTTLRQLSTTGLPPRLAFKSRPRLRLSTPRSHSRPNSTAPPGSQPTQEPTSAYARFKVLTKTYGSYAVLMYLALSLVDFTFSFALVHTVGADHIEPYMDKLVRLYREFRHGKDGADALELADQAKKAADEAEAAADLAINGPPTVRWWSDKTLWAELVLSYSIHKVLLLPVRAGLTVAWTPKVVNWLTKRGWIGKGGWRRGAQHGVDKARAAGQRAVDNAKDRVRR